MARPRLSGTRWTYFVMRYRFYRWSRQLCSFSEYSLYRGRLGCAIDAFLDTLEVWGNF